MLNNCRVKEGYTLNNKSNLYSKLPKVDEIISLVENRKDEIVDIPRETIVESIREEIDKLRKEISLNKIESQDLDERINDLPSIIIGRATEQLKFKLKRVINGTGVVIHTNLGRSLISNKVLENVAEVVTNYSNLEFDLENGKRGSRYSHLVDIITKVTGAEAAMVVNNNAAAVLLVLSSMAKDKEVVVSRGELVEIGGSFRVPDVMEQSGAKLVDVGTTNKTHLWDYENAIGEDTAAFLKVHTSNYRILGFTSSVELDEMVELGKRHDIPVIEDLGSGVLIDLSKYGLQHEPTVQESIKAGVDIVTFSGDKLLGGPQAGIIVGKKEYIDIMKKHPLTRAFRVDKFTIAALESTLRMFLNETQAIENIPTLKMITMTIAEIEKKANTLAHILEEKTIDKYNIQVVDEFSQVGGGSMPLEEIPTKAIRISPKSGSIAELEKHLRSYKVPIITRLYKENMYIDIRTIDEDDYHIVADGFKYAINAIEC